MAEQESFAVRLGNIGIAIREQRNGMFLLEGTSNKRKASVPMSMPDDEAIAEAKQQISSNSGEWPA